MKAETQRGLGSLDGVLAEAMRRERDRRTWRQSDLADRLGWPLSRVTRIEGWKQRVLVRDLVDMCRVLDMTMSDLLAQADPADLLALGLLPEATAGQRNELDAQRVFRAAAE